MWLPLTVLTSHLGVSHVRLFRDICNVCLWNVQQTIYLDDFIVLLVSGHLLRSLCIGDKGRWLAKIQAQWVTQQGRNKIYDTLFTLRHMKGTKDTSFLMTSDLYMTFTARVPSDLQLKEWNKGLYKID